MSDFKLTTAVAFIVFNRLDCTMEVFEQIRTAKPAKLYIISDGPRADREGEDKLVADVRAYIDEHIDWECEVHRKYAEKNLGCKYNIYHGINWVFETEEQAMIIEDDCVPNQTYFRYCQELLDLYKNDENVWMISGINTCRKQRSKDEYFFAKFSDIWGWATWRRAWTKVDMEMDSWEECKKTGALKYAYDFWSYRCYLRVAKHQTVGKRGTWDVPWVYTIVKNHGLGIIPRENMVANIGCGRADATQAVVDVKDDFSYGKEIRFPLQKKDVIEDPDYDREVLRDKMGWKKEWHFIKYKFSRIIPKIKEKISGGK